jgi:pseudouridine-5'-monophosphatase
VAGARKAGMQVVMVPEDYIPVEYTKEATVVIKSLLDFKPEDFGLPPFEDS